MGRSRRMISVLMQSSTPRRARVHSCAPARIGVQGFILFFLLLLFCFLKGILRLGVDDSTCQCIHQMLLIHEESIVLSRAWRSRFCLVFVQSLFHFPSHVS